MKNKLKKVLFFLGVFSMVPSFSLAATPIIDDVSGNIATGQTLTITGNNMVDENYADWYKNESYSGSVLAQTYFTGANTVSGFAGWLTIGDNVTLDSTKKVLGDKSVKIVNDDLSCIQEPSCGGRAIYLTHWLDGNFCASAYVYLDGEVATHYHKFFLTVGEVGQFYVQPNPDGGWVIKDNPEVAYAGNADWTQTNKWHYWEVCIDKTNYSGDKYTVWWDGVKDVEHVFSQHYGVIAHYNELGIPNWSWLIGSTPTPFYMWINRYVNSATRIYPASIIEISGNGTNWKYQEPVYLSDGYSQIKLDLTGLSGTNYQLRVKNNRQETSSIYNLTGSFDTTAPASPIGLIIK